MSKHQQTKLSKNGKADVRVVRADFENDGGVVRSVPVWGVTVAIAPAFQGSRMAQAAVAVASPTEKKFRTLVGVDRAMAAHIGGACIPVRLPENFWLEDTLCRADMLESIAEELAATVGYF